MEPVCGHRVGRYDGAQGYRVLVCPFVSHDSYALDRKKYDSCLPDGIVEVGSLDSRVGCRREIEGAAVVVAQAFDVDVVSLAEYAELLFRDVSDDPDGE